MGLDATDTSTEVWRQICERHLGSIVSRDHGSLALMLLALAPSEWASTVARKNPQLLALALSSEWVEKRRYALAQFVIPRLRALDELRLRGAAAARHERVMGVLGRVLEGDPSVEILECVACQLRPLCLAKIFVIARAQ